MGVFLLKHLVYEIYKPWMFRQLIAPNVSCRLLIFWPDLMYFWHQGCAKSKKPPTHFSVVHVYSIGLYLQQLFKYKRHHGVLHKIMYLVLDVCKSILIKATLKRKFFSSSALVFIQVYPSWEVVFFFGTVVIISSIYAERVCRTM